MNAVETPAIQKTPGVCGGKARVRNTRVPVWILVLKRKLGQPDADVLGSYPTLAQSDLDAAWGYYQQNPVEIEQAIWLNDVAGNVPDGAPVPAGVIIAGRLIGLDDDAIREAFDPPLAAEQIAAAWAEYRAEPVRVGRALPPLRPTG